MTDILVQLVGFTAMLFGVTSVQWKHRRNILLNQIMSSALWIVHFALLGAISGAAMNAAGVVRTGLFFIFSGKRRRWWALALALGVVIGAGMLAWTGLISMMPLAGMTVGTIALWQRDEQKTRLLFLIAAPLWFVYNLNFGSYAGMTTEILMFTSSLVAFFRYRRIEQRQVAVNNML